MIREFTYRFSDLEIAPADLFDLLGFEEELPAPFPEMIGQVLDQGPSLCNIRGGYRIFDTVDVDRTLGKIGLNGVSFDVAKTISAQLRKATKAALFVCTAGELIAERSKKLSAEDPVLAYVFDVLGSVVVEKATDKIEMALAEEAGREGLNISNRYSPGYCNWPLSDQHKLFGLLPEIFCGVSLSESALMFPIKSVSGIIGMGAALHRKAYQCSLCSDTHCFFRRLKRNA